jgi:hypothetical protein
VFQDAEGVFGEADPAEVSRGPGPGSGYLREVGPREERSTGLGHTARASRESLRVRNSCQCEAATISSASRAGCSRKIPWSVSISTTSAPTDAAITRCVSGGTRVSAVVRT